MVSFQRAKDASRMSMLKYFITSILFGVEGGRGEVVMEWEEMRIRKGEN